LSAERRPGSNLGRATIDWDEAFLFYASLPVERRDYQAVADEFEVSRRTVERHGRSDNWKQRAAELDRESVKAAVEQIRDKRAAKLVETENVVEATIVTYANQLVAGQVKVRPLDIVKLVELREKIWQHQDDTQTDDQPAQASQPADPGDEVERKRQVLHALGKAGVLGPFLASLADADSADERDVA